METIKLKFRPSTKNNKEGILSYQIIHERVVKQIKTNYKFFPEEWNEDELELVIPPVQAERAVYLATVRDRIKWDVKKIELLINRLSKRANSYSADDVVLAFEKHPKGELFFEFMEQTIVQLKSLHKIRTSETYSIALKSFIGFRQGIDVLLDELDSDIMQQYEAYLKVSGVTMNTVSFYMRILRATYNRAVEKEIVAQHYPFKHVYTGVDKTIKRAASLQVIKQIKGVDLSHSASLSLARDLFLFSFYTRGMSFVDMAYLKKVNLRNGVLSYRRRKTNQQLHIKWERCMQVLVEKYNTNSTVYLLPIVTNSEQDARRQYQTALGKMNLKLKKIAKMIGYSTPLTMYVARHSWASIARSYNVPLSVISEGMGHENETTTQIYLASLDTSIVDKANRMILKLL